MNWDDLLKRAKSCLSSDEITAIKHQKEKYEQTNLSFLFGVSKTVQDVIDDDARQSVLEKRGEELLELTAGGGSPEPVNSPPSVPVKSPGAWVIPEAVQFLYRESEASDGTKEPDATSFILMVPDKLTKGSEAQLSLRFLVTARHVIEPSWANCSTPNPDTITVRFNKRGGGVAYDQIPLRRNGRRLFFTDPADNLTDLAVVSLTTDNIPHLLDYKFIDVGFHVLATDAESSNISINQEVMTAGLLPDFPGQDKNFPIFKRGVMSSVPDEPIKVDCENQLHPKSTRLWLFTPELSPGASGSPVFTVANRGLNARTNPILIGVQSTTWLGKGVSGFTPSQYLVPLITKAAKQVTEKATRKFELDFYRGPIK